MKIKLQYLLLGSALVFFGCTQGPDFKAPHEIQTKTYLPKQ